MSKVTEEYFHLTPAETARMKILIVESNSTIRRHMTVSLQSMGFKFVDSVSNHSSGLEKIKKENITHTIFESNDTDMSSLKFLKQMMEEKPDIVCISTSDTPDADIVFDLIINGARGFITKPITPHNLEEGIAAATKTEKVAPSMEGATSRNEALASMMLNSLSLCCKRLKQAKTSGDGARKVADKAISGFYRASGTARAFAKGGDESLLDALIRLCEKKNQTPATRLGKLRKRLGTTRK